jgi:hypothetical protein
MLPTATPTLPDTAALTVIAISGRFVAIASMINPPSAAPKCSCSDSTSVWSDSWIPATQMAAAAATKINSSTGNARPDTCSSYRNRKVRCHLDRYRPARRGRTETSRPGGRLPRLETVAADGSGRHRPSPGHS